MASPRSLLKPFLAFSLISLLLQGLLAAQTFAQAKTEVARLADAERAFAARSVADGMRAAFLEYFAPDGINFMPHPVNTRESINSRPAPLTKPPITLDWWPVFGDVSLSGDLGYTTGPYVLTDAREGDKVVGQGYYFSVWKRQPDGHWRVALDYGIETTPPGAGKANAIFRSSRWTGANVAKASATGPNNLLARENDFSEQVARRGLLAAYRDFTSWDDETRLYRDQQNPIVGRKAISTYLKGLQYKPLWQTTASAVAESGDLAHTYGRWESGSEISRTGYFVRVWRLIRGDWRVVMEVMNPLPSQ